MFTTLAMRPQCTARAGLSGPELTNPAMHGGRLGGGPAPLPLMHLFVSSPGVLRGPRGGQVPARGPAGGAVMRAAARVTSRRGHTRKMVPGAAVRDAGRGDGRRDPAGRAPGDVGRRDQVAVAR